MSHRYSIAQRSPALNALFAGAACAVALALTAGSAMAETSTMERVTVRGRVIEAPVRYDVHASCAGIDDQIGEALDFIAARARLYSDVQVQFVMENGRIEGVQTQGRHGVLRREVATAVRRLACGPQSTAGAQIFRFSVAFVDPSRMDRTQTANGTAHTVRIAQIDR